MNEANYFLWVWNNFIIMWLGWNVFFFLLKKYSFLQGAALIRMLANFMGHSVFQRGLQVSKMLSIFSYTFPCSCIYFFFQIYLFIYLFMAALGLRCCARAFKVHSLLWCADFSCCGARALGTRASVVVAHRLSWSAACGIFPDQVSNPCPRDWQADSQPLCHQGSVSCNYFKDISQLGKLLIQKCWIWWKTLRWIR